MEGARPDEEPFLRWSDRVRNACKENGWMPTLCQDGGERKGVVNGVSTNMNVKSLTEHAF